MFSANCTACWGVYLAIEGVEPGERAAGRAGEDTFRLLLRTDEKMKAKWFHCELRPKK
jgi:hypothetical protein